MKEKLVKNLDGSQGRIIHLDIEEVKKLCRPGAGADTCIWLVSGKGGFDCLFYNRRAPSLTGEILEDRWKAGLTVAKRDGCEEILKFKRYERIDKFHAHLDICSQCRNHPFGLCPAGAKLLEEAGEQSRVKEEMMALPTYEEFRAASLEQKKELLQRIKLRRIQHRVQDHHDETLTTFHDCATCGVIENRIKNFEEELYA